MNKKLLRIAHLDAKLQVFQAPAKLTPPSTGWIKAIRITLGMSLRQLGKKLMITKQSMQEMEQREIDGSITIRALNEVARVMDMKLVYGFVPLDNSLDALLERKSKEIATKIVMRTSQSMVLEDQENSKERIEKSIVERAEEIKTDLSKILWE